MQDFGTVGPTGVHFGVPSVSMEAISTALKSKTHPRMDPVLCWEA